MQAGTTDDEQFNTSLPLNSILDKLSNKDFHEIRDFLSRPIKLSTNSWTTTAVVGSNITTIDLLSDLNTISSFISGPILTKLQGFLGFRGVARLRVQVNAQPFQTGSLMLGYFPLYNKMPNHYSPATDESINAISYTSASPHAVLDIAQETDITLDCPYISPHSWYNLTQNDLTWGRAFLKVMAPLRSIATAFIPVTIYLSFHDVEFYGATSIPANYQAPDEEMFEMVNAPKDSGTQTDLIGVSGVRQRGAREGFRREYSAPKAEMGTQTDAPQAPQQERKTQQREGVISGFARATSNIAKVIGMAAPPLAFVTKPVSWIADIVEWGAKKFGFCKPTNLAPVNGFKQQPTKYNTCGDAEVHSHPLGLLSNNELQTVNFSGSETDEMHFASILKRPCVRDTFNWTTTDNVGSILWQTFVSPVAGPDFVTTYNTPTDTSWQPILMTYLSLAFKQWTGSINYRFQIFLNSFYSGRLRFVFVPGNPNIALTGDQLLSSYNSYAIVDIRSKSTFEMNVPYVATVPFKQVEPMASQANTAINLDHSSTGRIFVVVEENLRAPDTVSNTLSCFISQWAGDDFQLSVPKQPNFSPMTEADTVRPEALADLLVDYQGLTDAAPSLEIQPVSILRNAHEPMTFAKAACCVGEHVDSLRVLLKRFMAFAPLRTTASALTQGHWSYLIFPHFLTWNSTGVLSDPGQNHSNNYSFVDYISYFSQIYAFRRGGVRIQLQGLSNWDKVGVSWGYVSNTNLDAPAFTNTLPYLYSQDYDAPASAGAVAPVSHTTDFASDDFVYPLIQSLEGLYDFEVPYYSNVPFVINPRITPSSFVNSNALLRDRPFTSHYLPYGVIHAELSEAADSAIYRSAAEDFSFGFLHGPPRVRRTRQGYDSIPPPTK